MLFEDMGQVLPRSQPEPRYNYREWTDLVYKALQAKTDGLHASGFNVCYADGHAKWLPRDQAAKNVKFCADEGTYCLGDGAAFDLNLDSIDNPYKR